MCFGVRCTVRRATPRSRMCARVLTARRSRRSFLVVLIGHRLQSLLLPFLQGDLLARVAHPLALVGLGRPYAADLRRHLADLLPVDALDDDLGLARGLD